MWAMALAGLAAAVFFSPIVQRLQHLIDRILFHRLLDTLETIRGENKIILTIAHRLSTVLHSDKIVVIRDGEIEAQGKHEELLKISPTYKRMHDVQLQDS